MLQQVQIKHNVMQIQVVHGKIMDMVEVVNQVVSLQPTQEHVEQDVDGLMDGVTLLECLICLMGWNQECL
jgi:hypothetical protein